jgi:tRNA threonylcarbamoyladenosine biosynthesis protein TsaB
VKRRAPAPRAAPAAPPGPLLLGLETSTPLGGAALAGPQGLLAERALGIGGSHAARLMVAVDALLDEAGITLADLAGIGISVGPGSFTGLRVGVATAQGLARGSGLPLFPVSSLEAVAWALPAALAPSAALPPSALAVVMTARREEVYGAVYRAGGEALAPLLAPVAAPPEALAADLAALEVPLLLGGTAALDLAARARRLGARVTLAPHLFACPRAAVVAWRAAVMHAAGEAFGPEAVVPRYLAPSQAEVRADARAEARARAARGNP